MELEARNTKIRGLLEGNIHFLFGKNGSGKSRLLQGVDKKYRREENENDYYIKYVTPERGSDLERKSGVEQRMMNNKSYIYQDRRNNYSSNFRAQTITNFFLLRDGVRKKFEKNPESAEKFGNYLNKINELLDEVKIKESLEKGFVVKDEDIAVNDLSSGEKELITLAVEILHSFFEAKNKTTKTILLIDEPDVHLHPELQVRLIRFLNNLLKDSKNVYVMIATHSTALLSSAPESKIALMQSGDTTVRFEDLSEKHQKVLPVFGAHLISGIFNQQTLFLVEGIDDEEIWSLVSRSVELDLYPTEVGGRPDMNDYEEKANKIAETLYDNPLIYSLRDRDEDESEEVEDFGCVCRFKTSCRNIENLLISEQALDEIGTNWNTLKGNVTDWLDKTENQSHDKYDQINQWKGGGFLRKNANIKPFVNKLLEISDSQYSWKVIVANALSKNQDEAENLLDEDNSIFNYLGEKITKEFFTQNET